MGTFDTCLCHIKKKEILDNVKDFAKIVDTPKFVCTSCARVANQKKNLCKPKKIKK